MLKCHPFLLFDGNCAEAMTFYHECLGGELTLSRLDDTPMKDMLPLEKHDRIINANLVSGRVEISATDWMSDEHARQPGNNTAIFIVGEGYDELRSVFDKLSQGAAKDITFQDLHDLPFGTCGQFTDRFGISWIFKGDRV